MKTCPYCAEAIRNAATLCTHCGRDVKTGRLPGSARAAGTAAALSLFIPGGGQMQAEGKTSGVVWLLATIAGYILFIPLGLLIHIVCVALAATAGGERKPAPADDATAAVTAPGLSRVHTVGALLFVVIGLELLFGLTWLAGY